MQELSEISKIGLGTYRMSLRNPEHIQSLKYALDNGINLIDTASNYQLGNSEKLIGKVLDKKERKSAFIISKAGYVQGEDIIKFSNILNSSRTIRINNSFLYSIAPEFLEAQVYASLKRLNTDYLDGFLIHNPEHYFDVENKNQKLLNEHIGEACMFLESLVKKGTIKQYGISSNILAKKTIDLSKIANNYNNFPNFKLLQFPFNLIENEASLKINGSETLIDFCKKNKITTFGNRPLNTSYNSKVIRLADYSDDIISVDFKKEELLFDRFLDLIQKQLLKFGEKSKLEDFSPIKFFIVNRMNIANPEAVHRAIDSHLLPFVGQLQFSDNMINDIIKELREYWLLYSKRNITQRAYQLRNSLVSSKIINESDKRNLSIIACEKYIESGINHVLVGMRKKKYIDDLLPLV